VLPLEVKVARDALAAAGMGVGDVDLIIVSSFLPDQLGVGNAPFLARELGTKCAAWNLEATCASSIVAFQTACGLVQAGQYRNVLVVVSCTYSRVADEADTLSWFTGDGVGAFVVGKVKDGEGLLGMKTVATTETCNTFYYEADPTSPRGTDAIVMRCTRETGRVLHETSEPHLRACCMGALDDAKLKLRDVDFVVTNTPSSWFAAFVARALGIDRARTIDTYPKYANIGGALMPTNLYAAAEAGKIKPGSVVLLYGFGGVSTASAAVLRWGPVGLGTSPSSAG
jgi:3-oxoacyl-[acyl-carrier-protein] synthase-3